jgi:hypothetical protein
MSFMSIAKPFMVKTQAKAIFRNSPFGGPAVSYETRGFASTPRDGFAFVVDSYTIHEQCAEEKSKNTLGAGWDGATGGMRPSYATTTQELSSLATL